MEAYGDFTLSPETIDKVAKIAELVGELHGSGEYKRNLRLRKVNRLKSIQSSLAIEANTLSLEEVTDVIDGKKVRGSQREIQEVKNAYKAYDNLPSYKPYDVDDFLRAHSYMTDGLVKTPGEFRSGGVGVFNGKGELIHAGAHPDFVPRLINNLFAWAQSVDLHPLIKSSIMHFEIEYIHPFADGNGRTGRLWQTVVLSQWDELFQWLPVETVIHENQQHYYDSLNISEKQGSSSVFIEFMITAIYEALKTLPTLKITDIFTDISTDKLTKTELEFLEEIAGYLGRNREITNYRAQLITGRSAGSVKKLFATLVEKGILQAEGKNKGRKYTL